MKDILFDIFNDNTKGAEIYKCGNSLWMILPEENEWVFEIETDLTLWYNLSFFEKIYKYVSLNAIEHEHYIIEWVEDIIKKTVKNTFANAFVGNLTVEDILKKGIRGTYWTYTTLDTDEIDEILNTGEKLK